MHATCVSAGQQMSCTTCIPLGPAGLAHNCALPKQLFCSNCPSPTSFEVDIPSICSCQDTTSQLSVPQWPVSLHRRHHGVPWGPSTRGHAARSFLAAGQGAGRPAGLVAAASGLWPAAHRALLGGWHRHSGCHAAEGAPMLRMLCSVPSRLELDQGMTTGFCVAAWAPCHQHAC